MRHLVLVLACCCLVITAPAETNKLGFYLLSEDVPRKELWDAAINPAMLKLMPDAVLSDADFRSYNTNNHYFTVTAVAAKRLGRAVWKRGPTVRPSDGMAYYELCGPDTLFVLVASGEPIYAGTFSSPNSSTFYASHMVQPTPEFMYLETNSTNNVTFRISMNLMPPEQASLAGKNPVPDLRSDKRILAALKKLGL